jgi:hypothetical protein
MGFATWAASEEDVLARVPGKLEEYRLWLSGHEVQIPVRSGDAAVVERVRGNEVLFSEDIGPCSQEEVDLAIELLSHSRADLLAAVHSMPSGALDWDPPYRSFAGWASWRTVRQILAHIANTESHYYLPSIGYEPRIEPALADGDWEEFIELHRAETLRNLRDLRDSVDRSRVTRDEEEWSARKVLRRLVRHELLHLKSVVRIGKEYVGGTPN